MNTAPNLVTGQLDFNQKSDIFLHDRITDATVLVSHASSSLTRAGDRESANPSISADGRYVSYESFATDLVPGFIDVNGTSNSDVFLYDRLTGNNVLVSSKIGSVNTGGNNSSFSPLISANGVAIGYSTLATDVVGGLNPSASQNAIVFDCASATPSLISHKHTTGSEGASGFSEFNDLSADGRYIVMTSNAPDVFPSGQTVTIPSQIYIHDRLTGINSLVTHKPGAPTELPNNNSIIPIISADGKIVSYNSRATDLVAGMTGSTTIVRAFVYDRLADVNTLVTHSAGSPLTGVAKASALVAINGNGQYIAYSSLATDLVNGFVDGNGTNSDIYLYDRLTNASQLVTAQEGTSNVGGNALSGGDLNSGSISADGRYLAFQSEATNLVPSFGATSVVTSNVYLFDRIMQTNVLVSHASGAASTAANGDSRVGEITPDGQLITFSSDSTNQPTGIYDSNSLADVFHFMRITGSITLASRRSGALPASPGGLTGWTNNATSLRASDRNVSRDGRYVVFASTARNIVPGQSGPNPATNVFLYDRIGNTSQLVSHVPGSATVSATGSSADPALSADGRYVYFTSFAKDLVAGFVDSNGPDKSDVYVFDRMNGSVTLVSHKSGFPTIGGDLLTGSGNHTTGYSVAVSDDGRYASYTSYATDLMGGFVDNNSQVNHDLFLYDRILNTSTLISHDCGSASKGTNNGPILNSSSLPA